jgi:hypothetical protein
MSIVLRARRRRPALSGQSTVRAAARQTEPVTLFTATLFAAGSFLHHDRDNFSRCHDRDKPQAAQVPARVELQRRIASGKGLGRPSPRLQ